MQKCHSCNHGNKDQDAFCVRCGKPLQQAVLPADAGNVQPDPDQTRHTSMGAEVAVSQQTKPETAPADGKALARIPYRIGMEKFLTAEDLGEYLNRPENWKTLLEEHNSKRLQKWVGAHFADPHYADMAKKIDRTQPFGFSTQTSEIKALAYTLLLFPKGNVHLTGKPLGAKQLVDVSNPLTVKALETPKLIEELTGDSSYADQQKGAVERARKIVGYLQSGLLDSKFTSAEFVRSLDLDDAAFTAWENSEALPASTDALKELKLPQSMGVVQATKIREYLKENPSEEERNKQFQSWIKSAKGRRTRRVTTFAVVAMAISVGLGYQFGYKPHVDEQAWKIAYSFNTVASYSTYINEQSSGSFVPEARERIANIDFAEAENKNTVEGYESFLSTYSVWRDQYDGTFKVPQAKSRIANILLSDALDEGTEEALEEFLTSSYAYFAKSEAENALEKLVWENAIASASIKQIDAYAKRYPDGNFIELIDRQKKEIGRRVIASELRKGYFPGVWNPETAGNGHQIFHPDGKYEFNLFGVVQQLGRWRIREDRILISITAKRYQPANLFAASRLNYYVNDSKEFIVVEINPSTLKYKISDSKYDDVFDYMR